MLLYPVLHQDAPLVLQHMYTTLPKLYVCAYRPHRRPGVRVVVPDSQLLYLRTEYFVGHEILEVVNSRRFLNALPSNRLQGFTQPCNT